MPRDYAERVARQSVDSNRRREQTQQTLRRELVTRAAASRARASIAWTQDERVRPDGLTDAEWACVLVRDAEPGTAAAVIAVALACEVADRAEARGADPRQLGLFGGEDDGIESR